MMEIYIASGNRHKLEEFRDLLGALESLVRIRSADELGGMPEVEETADSFRGNAELKAAALLEKAPQTAWVLSDDSGLEVDALGGAPGVYSARFAGPFGDAAANNDKLLHLLEGEANRSARFVCVLCLKTRGQVIYFEGTSEGLILEISSGQHGFGYDPLFQPHGYDESFARLGPEVKGRISHRSRAVKLLSDWLKARL